MLVTRIGGLAFIYFPASPLSCFPAYHAEGGTRTRTGLRPLRPERSASTSSTTSASAQATALEEHNQPAERRSAPVGLTLPKWWPILCLGMPT
jgi:hypothetical protein